MEKPPSTRLMRALLWCEIPGWAACWPLGRSPEREAELTEACRKWQEELSMEPTRKRALSLAQRKLGAVMNLDPVGDGLRGAREALFGKVQEIVDSR